MKIDTPKIVYIYFIILIVMYLCVIKGNIVKEVCTFTDRSEYTSEDNILLETDYSLQKHSEYYLKFFLSRVNSMSEEELKTYFDTEYYEKYSTQIKKTLSSKVRVRNTSLNESYIEYVKDEVNDFGQRVVVYNILVMRKGMTYPEGYNILVEEKSQDKNKSIDIQLVEISPYNYVLQIPEKEFVG